jgi:hypothetical protein
VEIRDAQQILDSMLENNLEQLNSQEEESWDSLNYPTTL